MRELVADSLCPSRPLGNRGTRVVRGKGQGGGQGREETIRSPATLKKRGAFLPKDTQEEKAQSSFFVSQLPGSQVLHL